MKQPTKDQLRKRLTVLIAENARLCDELSRLTVSNRTSRRPLWQRIFRRNRK